MSKEEFSRSTSELKPAEGGRSGGRTPSRTAKARSRQRARCVPVSGGASQYRRAAAGRPQDEEQSMRLHLGERGSAPLAAGRNFSFSTMEKFTEGSDLH